MGTRFRIQKIRPVSNVESSQQSARFILATRDVNGADAPGWHRGHLYARLAVLWCGCATDWGSEVHAAVLESPASDWCGSTTRRDAAAEAITTLVPRARAVGSWRRWGSWVWPDVWCRVVTTDGCRKRQVMSGHAVWTDLDAVPTATRPTHGRREKLTNLL